MLPASKNIGFYHVLIEMGSGRNVSQQHIEIQTLYTDKADHKKGSEQNSGCFVIYIEFK